MNYFSSLCFSVAGNNSLSFIEYFIELVKKIYLIWDVDRDYIRHFLQMQIIL